MKPLLLLCCLLTLGASAQINPQPFAISPAYPLPGSKIIVTYKDKGTVLAGKKNISGVIYSYANFKWQADDLVLTWKDTAWTASYQLPVNCALISCIFQSGTITDNGGRMTYSWILSDANKRQMPGGYAAWGMLRSPFFKHSNPFQVDTTAYIATDVTSMWFRNEVRNNPSARPFVFRQALTFYKWVSKDSSTDQNIRNEIQQVLQMPDLTEQAWIDAQAIYAEVLRDKNAADSLQQIILQQFPKGITARDTVIYSLTREADLPKKIKGFEALINDFPPALFRDVETPVTNLYYSKLFRAAVYTPIIKDSNYANFYKYLSLVPTSELSTFYHHLVEIPHEQQKMPLPTLLRLSDSLYRQIMSRPADGVYSPLQWKARNLQLNSFVLFTHAQLLLENNQSAKALAVAGLVNPIYNYKKAAFNEMYVRLLKLNGQQSRLMPYILSSARENALTPYMLDLLKKDYQAKHKTAKGFEAWLDTLKSKDKMASSADHIKSQLVNLPIAPFRLERAKGGFADLDQLKGKIVVLDFWATWCGPCKAAMPGMQLAVNKYKADSNVAFYFIATQETKPDYKDLIKKFIADKKYSFEVLYDGYNKESKHLDDVYARYAKAYTVSGIPLKMIIDQHGRLRWINTGYMGSPSALADEIAFIIEFLKKEESAQPKAQTTSSTTSVQAAATSAIKPYKSEEVFFFNADSSIRFSGTLTLPAGKSSSKAVVLVSGTGKQDRDGTMAGHKMFATIADTLTRNGISVLRVDDRGTGQTTGKYEGATTEDFADDALLAVHYLKTRKEIDSTSIGLLGHSEGGAAVAIAAAKSKEVKFIISLAGLAIKGIEALIEQNEQLVNTANIPQLNKNRSNEINRIIFYTVYNNADAPDLEKKIRDAYAAWKIKDDRLIDSLQIKYDHFRFPLESYVRQATGKWYRYHIRFDPALHMARIKAPVLAIHGNKDLMLQAVHNLANWQHYTAINNKAVTVKLMPELNHLLQHCNSCTPDEYAIIQEDIAPEVLKEIRDWLTEH